MRLEIISYNERANHWVCRDEQGKIHRVDLAVCGTDDGGLIGKSPNDFNGRFIESGDLHPFEEIASDVLLEALPGKEKK